MTLEQDARTTVDALLARLREAIERDVRGMAGELVTQAAAERQALLDDARRTAESAQAAAVVEATARARQAADAEAAARFAEQAARMEQETEDSVAAVRRESQAELAGARQASQAELARTRDEAAAEQKRVVNAEVAKVRDEAERVLASSLADAQGAAVDAAASEARVTAERALADEIAQAREEARRGQQAALAAVSRLLDSVRRLDAQPTLTDVLDTLTELVAAEAGRVAVFVASDGEMRGWRLAGFGPEAGEARDRILNGADAGFLSRAIGTRQTRVLPAGGARTDADRPPAFTALPGDRSALAVPVLIGGETMVLVYADDVNTESRSILSQWSDAVELLARHAGHRLEALTADRAAALAKGIEPAPQPANAPGFGSAPPQGIGESEADEAARRYARLLVSEIKLYNEGAVTEGRAERDLGHRLKGEIDRARGLYEERIPSSVRSRRLFFDQELVRTLADGDPSLLGT